MWKTTKYLYYKFYKLFIRINGPNDLPEITASIAVGTLYIFNLLAIITIINLFYPIWYSPDLSKGKFFVILGIPYILVLYFSFVFNGKYKRIINEFKDENDVRRRKGRINVIMYILISIIIEILSLFLTVVKNKGLF